MAHQWSYLVKLRELRKILSLQSYLLLVNEVNESLIKIPQQVESMEEFPSYTNHMMTAAGNGNERDAFNPINRNLKQYYCRYQERCKYNRTNSCYFIHINDRTGPNVNVNTIVAELENLMADQTNEI